MTGVQLSESCSRFYVICIYLHYAIFTALYKHKRSFVSDVTRVHTCIGVECLCVRVTARASRLSGVGVRVQDYIVYRTAFHEE